MTSLQLDLEEHPMKTSVARGHKETPLGLAGTPPAGQRGCSEPPAQRNSIQLLPEPRTAASKLRINVHHTVTPIKQPEDGSVPG